MINKLVFSLRLQKEGFFRIFDDDQMEKELLIVSEKLGFQINQEVKNMPKFEREIEIDAPLEKVWKVMTDPLSWPNWFPGIDSVSTVTSVNAGSTFEWEDDGETGHGTIVALEPLKSFEVLTQMGEDKDSHKFKLKATGGFLGLANDECKVEYVLDTLVGGGILGNFITGGNPKDAIRVKKAMHNLRKFVESQ